MEQVLSKVIPIVLLIFTGYMMKRTQFVTLDIINGIKKLIVNIALPAVLFLSFITIELKKEYIGLTVAMILMLVTLNLLGRVLNRIKSISNPILPFIISAFAFGLLGTSLYEAVFGIEHVGDISILGIGHELFVWFIYINLLKIDFSHEKIGMVDFLAVLKSPMLLSVVAGILCNVLGLTHFLDEVSVLKGLYQTVKYFSQMGTPLILMMVGYGLELDKKYVKATVLFVMIRRVSLFVVGYGFKFFILARFMTMTPAFNHAFFTFLILPPPFLLSIFIETHGTVRDQKTKDNITLANNIIVLDTVLCIITYILFAFVINL